MTRIVVGLSPLWLGALFLAFENTSGWAEKPLSAGVASATDELAKAPARSPSTSHAALTTETPPAPGVTPDPIVEPSSEDASPEPNPSNADATEDGRLVQRTPEKLGTLPQIAWDEPVAEPVAEPLTATVQQPTWMPQPKPEHLARPSPEPEAPAELPNVTAVSGSPEPRDQGDRWKYPPDPAADSGEPGQETPSVRTAAADPFAAPLSGARVVIHEPGSGAGARDLLSVLRTQGVGVAEIRTVGASVSQPDIRFFHERDRAVAEQVVRMLSRQGYQPKVKDFTHYQQPPARGTVEVWLPG